MDNTLSDIEDTKIKLKIVKNLISADKAVSNPIIPFGAFSNPLAFSSAA